MCGVLIVGSSRLSLVVSDLTSAYHDVKHGHYLAIAEMSYNYTNYRTLAHRKNYNCVISPAPVQSITTELELSTCMLTTLKPDYFSGAILPPVRIWSVTIKLQIGTRSRPRVGSLDFDFQWY